MIVLKNARVIDGVSDEAQDGMFVAIEDGKVASVGAMADAPHATAEIDLEGKTVIPGLIDAHVHLCGGWDFSECTMGSGAFSSLDAASARERLLRWGVTAVRSGGELCGMLEGIHDRLASGAIAVSPKIVAPTGFFQAPEGHPAYTVFNLDAAKEVGVFVDESTDIEAEVAKQVEDGADVIKVFYTDTCRPDPEKTMPRITKEQLAAVCDAAHAHGKKVMCHVDTFDEAVTAAECGCDTIEHVCGPATPSFDFPDEMVERFAATGAYVVPTVCSRTKAGFMPGDTQDAFVEFCGRLKDAGVPIAVGCDSGVPFVGFGESLHEELEWTTKMGFTPMEAIQLATAGNAVMLGIDDVTGSIEPGKAADLVVLEADPLKDISNTRKIGLVLLDGHIVFDGMLD